jgi:integrase
MRLTAKQVENAKHGATRVEKPAGNGLYLVIQPKPSRSLSWALRCRRNGKPCKLTLGPAIAAGTGEETNGALTLAAARLAAAAVLDKLARGIDPAEAKPKPPVAAESFESVAKTCLTREMKRLRSAERQLHDLKRLVFPTLGARPIADVRRGDVVRLLDKIEDRHGPVMADSILGTISKIVRWWAIREETYAPCIVPGMRRSKPKERARKRILSDGELRAVWTAAEADTGWFGPFVQFLLTTACRRNEAAGMRHGELSGGAWTCPAARSKTKVAIERPLSAMAQAALAKAPKIAGDLVFTVDGKNPVTSFARQKETLDKTAGVTGWVTHDLRRTARSLLSRAGVPREHSERCLGHAIGGVEGTYDRHRYIEEMAVAYERLASLIETIVHPQENVVAMQRR